MIDPGVLAFIGPDGNVWTMAPTGAGKRRITLNATPDTPYTAPAWSPDGVRLLSVQRSPPALVTFSAPDFKPQEFPAEQVVMAAWGPGVDEITLGVSIAARRVVRVTIISDTGRHVVSEVPWRDGLTNSPLFPTHEALLPHANQVAWSPRGNVMVLTWPEALGNTGAILDMTKGVMHDLAALVPELIDVESLTSVRFIDDSTLFACVRADGHAGAARIVLGGAVQWVRGAEGFAALSVPAQDRIYYVQRPTENPSLWQVSANGGVPEEVLAGRLTFAPPDRFQNCIFWGLPSFAPNGSLFAIDQIQVDGQVGTPLYQAMETIWLATPDGLDARLLGLGRNVTWQP